MVFLALVEDQPKVEHRHDDSYDADVLAVVEDQNLAASAAMFALAEDIGAGELIDVAVVVHMDQFDDLEVADLQSFPEAEVEYEVAVVELHLEAYAVEVAVDLVA